MRISFISLLQFHCAMKERKDRKCATSQKRLQSTAALANKGVNGICIDTVTLDL